MHTRKRHQDMFLDLNKKILSADKDRESPPVDAKAAKRWSVSSTSSDKTTISVKPFFLLPAVSSDDVLLLFTSSTLELIGFQLILLSQHASVRNQGLPLVQSTTQP